MRKPIHKMRAACALAASAVLPGAWAHGGHGMPGEVHWHATDVWGLLLVAALAGVALWISRGGK